MEITGSQFSTTLEISDLIPGALKDLNGDYK
jgi:hypothetical protein